MAGQSGLMSAADKTKLDGIQAGAQVNTVTGIKGNAETTYRTGNINLTAANIGAAAASHDHVSIQIGKCATAAKTAAKTVTLSGFTLKEGAIIGVIMQYVNTAANPTLNVNSTGAHPIIIPTGGTPVAFTSTANQPVFFYYTGSQNWRIVDAPAFLDTNAIGTLSIAHGGTGATTAAAARTALGAAASDHTHSNASTAANGFMSAADKTKLDAYSAVSNESGKFMSASGTWQTPKDDDSWKTEDLILTETTDGLEVRRANGTVEFLIPLAGTY